MIVIYETVRIIKRLLLASANTKLEEFTVHDLLQWLM